MKRCIMCLVTHGPSIDTEDIIAIDDFETVCECDNPECKIHLTIQPPVVDKSGFIESLFLGLEYVNRKRQHNDMTGNVSECPTRSRGYGIRIGADVEMSTDQKIWQGIAHEHKWDINNEDQWVCLRCGVEMK